MRRERNSIFPTLESVVYVGCLCLVDRPQTQEKHNSMTVYFDMRREFRDGTRAEQHSLDRRIIR